MSSHTSGLNRQGLNSIVIAIFWIFLAIALGAFGKHYIARFLTVKTESVFSTGIRYQFIHGLSLLFLGLFQLVYVKPHYLNKISYLFSLGIFLFSVHCYIYAFTGVKAFTFVIPVGGLVFLLAWTWLFFKLLRIKAGKV